MRRRIAPLPLPYRWGGQHCALAHPSKYRAVEDESRSLRRLPQDQSAILRTPPQPLPARRRSNPHGLPSQRHPYQRLARSVWAVVRDFGAAQKAGAGLCDRIAARRRCAHRDVRQRQRRAGNAGRLRRGAAAAGLCHQQRTGDALQRVGRDRRRRRDTAGCSGPSTCCRTRSRPISSSQMDQAAPAMQQALGGAVQ